MKGFFLSIEGIEGVGKSTAVKFIKQFLQDQRIDLLVTREPGGTHIAEQIRQILLKPDFDEKMVPETELLLMFASRVQHVQVVVKPALAAGKWVVSDRFVDASYAYQGGGRQVPMEFIQQLERWTVKDVVPNLTILLDAPATVGLARAKYRGPQDRIEQEKVDFFERVREGYLKRAEADPKRFHLIDATQSLSIVEQDLTQLLKKLIGSAS